MFLLRDLVSPRTWLAMTSHLAGLFIGFAVILVFTVGLGFGFSLLVVALIGLPVLGLTLRFADWFATAERARFALMLGVRIPAWPAVGSAGRVPVGHRAALADVHRAGDLERNRLRRCCGCRSARSRRRSASRPGPRAWSC